MYQLGDMTSVQPVQWSKYHGMQNVIASLQRTAKCCAMRGLPSRNAVCHLDAWLQSCTACATVHFNDAPAQISANYPSSTPVHS